MGLRRQKAGAHGSGAGELEELSQAPRGCAGVGAGVGAGAAGGGKEHFTHSGCIPSQGPQAERRGHPDARFVGSHCQVEPGWARVGAEEEHRL